MACFYIRLSQHSYLPINQSSALFGSLFISGLTVVFNATAVLTIIQLLKFRAENKRLNLKPLMIIISLLLVNAGYGFYSINSKTNPGQDINVGIVQGNIFSGDKF